MKLVDEPIKGLFVLQPNVFEDERGYFFESYSRNRFQDLGITHDFKQDNQSLSVFKNVIRGLHFQKPPYAQAKLVRAVLGSVYDVVVDIRKGSPTYGEHFGIELSAKNKLFLFIPEGFAHGFETLEDNSLFNYKCSSMYNKESEGGILWNDKDLDIKWNSKNPILSEKDKFNPKFIDFESQFVYKST
jgi:dTDP-4-dehydrorhamnose 3,5-epimerase